MALLSMEQATLHHLIGKPLVHRALSDLAWSLDAPLMYLELGKVPVVVASSPIAAGEIMWAHDATFASRLAWNTTVRMANADGYGLGFAPYSDLWRQLRRISVSELLGARRVQSFRRVREEEAARLAAAVAATSPGEPVNVGERVAVVIADSTVRAMIGDRFERREEFFEAVEELNKLTAGFSLGEVPSSWFVSFIGGGTFELIEHAIRQHEERRATIVLLRIQREGGLSVPLTMGSFKSLIFDLFGAGSETSATTLQWAMSELMRNPNTMKRAQAELRSVLNGKPKVTEDDSTPIKYLKLVSKQTLRLHPAAPLLVPRESRESCKILGICTGILLAHSNMELYHFDWTPTIGVKPSELDMTEEMGLSVRRKNDLHLHSIVFNYQ
ncbi:hypothetical protein SETIT_5G051000v2 [Setaria italica]|uniref:Uncharacterized protein n=1 Tax=Setaria italica TaxID=4555 RepID=A0A368R1D5_SETIT|nr:hypothetical protein SETIT_5G051000v2 [Setaria italica]